MSEKGPFFVAVEKIFGGWTALQLAVQHGFGGMESAEKARWMVHAVEQWFRENSGIEPYELEDFLADIMNNEFETVTSDGSLEQVSADICQCFNWCAAGNLAAVEQRLLQLTPAAVAACQGAPGDDNDDDDEGENVQNMEVVEEQPHRASSEQAQEEDDGWTTVKSKRK